MAWIETSPTPPPDPTLAVALDEALRGYPPEYAPGSAAQAGLPAAVRDDSIVLSHARIPGALGHVFAAHASMLDPAPPLSRREHELIATTVSALNRCFYTRRHKSVRFGSRGAGGGSPPLHSGARIHFGRRVY